MRCLIRGDRIRLGKRCEYSEGIDVDMQNKNSVRQSNAKKMKVIGLTEQKDS